MKYAVKVVWPVLVASILALQLGGCPGLPGVGGEIIEGTPGQTSQISTSSSVQVLTPAANLSITGGTPVEVNWQAFATTRFAVSDVIIDVDEQPDNDNEIVAFSNLSLTVSSALVDTTRLARGTYFIGVRLEEIGTVVAFDYAPGTITIDQRPEITFKDPLENSGRYGARDNVSFDRTQLISAPFEVVWELNDPDSTNATFVFLDPDEQPNGNEILLYESESQTGDSFQFDFPTASFDPGTYRFAILITDGRNAFTYYSPGAIRLRARLAGAIDLRNLDLPENPVRGAIFEGFNPRDNAGSFVSSFADIDGDGYGDFLIVSQFGKPQYVFNPQRTGIGEAYLIFGRPERFSGVINLNSTGTLFRGDIFTGPPETPDPIRPSRGITSFTVLSDWDFDGVREYAFGVPFTDSVSVAPGNELFLEQAGYFRTGGVVIGAGSTLRPDLGFPGRSVISLSALGTVGHVARACTWCGGETPCDCSDPEGGGPAEGFIGPKAPSPPGGCPSTTFHEHTLDVVPAPAARLGCRFSSTQFGDQFGESIATWDFDAIIMCAPNRDPIDVIPQMLLSNTSVPGSGVVSIFYNDVNDGFYPWTNNNGPQPAQDFDYPGSQQSTGDRFLPHGGPYHYVIDDLLWSPGYFVDPDDSEPCEVWTDDRIETPAWSLRIWSETPGARLSGVQSIRDINADGLLDLAIGAPLAAEGAGACYLVFGRLRQLVISGQLLIEELALPMSSFDPGQQRIFDGIRIVGEPGDRLGQSQGAAGDFNNDGLSDVVIGSPFVNERRGGAVVFFGSREVINLTDTEIPFNEVAARGLGVIFVGEQQGDLAGARVCGAGDLDGDGNSDILIAAPDRSVRIDLDLNGTIDVDRTECGVVYLIYGSPDLQNRVGGTNQRAVFRLADVGKDINEGGVPGVVFIGRNSGDHLGAGLGEQGDRSTGIAGVGDVDGDGTGDVLLSSVSAGPRDRARAGEAYLIYGTNE